MNLKSSKPQPKVLGWNFSPSVEKGRFALEIFLNFSTLTHALFLWVLWRFPPCLRRISTFFHPPQLGTYTYPLGTFSTPTPIGTPTFHLEHPPQIQTVVVGWSFKLIVLLGRS